MFAFFDSQYLVCLVTIGAIYVMLSGVTNGSSSIIESDSSIMEEMLRSFARNSSAASPYTPYFSYTTIN